MEEVKTSNAAATAHRKVDQYAEAAKDKVHAGIDKAEDAVQSLSGKAANAQAGVQKAIDTAMAQTDKVAACIRERPITSAIIMFGIGALLGSLVVGVRSRSRD